MGKSKKSTTISVRIPNHFKAEIDEKLAKCRVNINDYLYILIDFASGLTPEELMNLTDLLQNRERQFRIEKGKLSRLILSKGIVLQTTLMRFEKDRITKKQLIETLESIATELIENNNENG